MLTSDDAEPGASRPATIGVVAATGALAAATLAWSLRLAPGDRLFYAATLLVAVIYVVGSLAAARIDGTPLPWRTSGKELATAFGCGLALAVVFFVGAFGVRYVPVLRDPVDALLDHARQGSLPLVALTTAVNGIAEEVFFRGSLWHVVHPRRRILWTTIAYTAVTATAGIPLLALAAALLGVLVAVLRVETRSLVPPIVTHLTWSLLMLFVLPSVVH